MRIDKYLERRSTMPKLMLPWVMLFQLEGVYMRSGGRPRKVTVILRWTNKDWAYIIVCQ